MSRMLGELSKVPVLTFTGLIGRDVLASVPKAWDRVGGKVCIV